MTINNISENLFSEHFNGSLEADIVAPGRVNLIGEHTDYNQGFVFPVAINFGTQIQGAKRDDNIVEIVALDYDSEKSQFALDDIRHVETATWSNYVRGVVRILKAKYPQIKGASLLVKGNVPQGAGLSSSASFEVAVVKIFSELYNLDIDGVNAALIGQKAENEFVGCACGIMDQLISAMGAKGKAMLLDCQSLSFRHTHVSDDFKLLIINSNVKRGLVDSEYNLRREQCEAAAHIMGVASLREANVALLEANKVELGDVNYRRAKHIITDNQRTLDMFTALQQNDYKTINKLMRNSHNSMRDDFEITTSEIDYLVSLVDQNLGELGGVRMTGGGFGGCVVALVPNDKLDEIVDIIDANYQVQTGIKESVYVCTAEQGAFYQESASS
ncbi:galactokinase [Aliiglaciecola sp. 3_MG-2023]|uniref:galactokinase n=1 Tax=Aliiglaciecola sp. 3_MG-2023 TaxID=3062644 RepID=UPI0026E30C00|nr:galactokinase [Aliiglaciecola sp. 3_MG-2023]MDO6693136.1 galactokinase [Aliiglaciecola sp. 3_MG-2023]